MESLKDKLYEKIYKDLLNRFPSKKTLENKQSFLTNYSNIIDKFLDYSNPDYSKLLSDLIKYIQEYNYKNKLDDVDQWFILESYDNKLYKSELSESTKKEKKKQEEYNQILKQQIKNKNIKIKNDKENEIKEYKNQLDHSNKSNECIKTHKSNNLITKGEYLQFLKEKEERIKQEKIDNQNFNKKYEEMLEKESQCRNEFFNKILVKTLPFQMSIQNDDLRLTSYQINKNYIRSQIEEKVKQKIENKQKEKNSQITQNQLISITNEQLLLKDQEEKKVIRDKFLLDLSAQVKFKKEAKKYMNQNEKLMNKQKLNEALDYLNI